MKSSTTTEKTYATEVAVKKRRHNKWGKPALDMMNYMDEKLQGIELIIKKTDKLTNKPSSDICKSSTNLLILTWRCSVSISDYTWQKSRTICV